MKEPIVLEEKLPLKGSTPVSDFKTVRSNGGIALFMVIAAIGVLAVLVTEFTYIAQVNQRLAYDGLDQVRAHYLAKSAFKISLLRLKAYQNVRKFLGAQKQAAAVANIPKGLVEQIWSFPLVFPLPTHGMSSLQKEANEKFQKESGLKGNFTALIESESSKYNLNMILAKFAPKEKEGKKDENKDSSKKSDDSSSSSSSSSSRSSSSGGKKDEQKEKGFDVAEARRSLAEFLGRIFQGKVEADEDFATEYRDFRIEDLTEHIIAWADASFQAPNFKEGDEISPKNAPFYSITELHMLPSMNEDLYDLFAPNLTVSPTPGINVNTMQEAMLKAILPQITEEEIKEFFEFRDHQEEDNKFKKAADFFEYLEKNVAYFRQDKEEVKRYKEALKKRNIQIVTEESVFKVSVTAHVNQSTKVLEAMVAFEEEKKAPSSESKPESTPPQGANLLPEEPAPPSSGLKVFQFRII